MIGSVGCNGLSLCIACEEHDLKNSDRAKTPVTPVTPVTVDQIRRYIRYSAQSMPRYVTGVNPCTRYTCYILFLSGIGLLKLRKWISTFLRARYKAEVA